MSQNVENLSGAAENLAIEEAKFEKWSELPPEIKLECIKTLDFQARWALRSTCRTDRALVDSQRLNFDILYFRAEDYEEVTFSAGIGYSRFTAPLKMTTPVFLYIIDHGNFGNFLIKRLHNLSNLKEQIMQTRTLKVKTLELDGESPEMIFLFLDKVNDTVKSIHIRARMKDPVAYKELSSHPKIVNVRSLRVTELEVPGFTQELADAWMKNDAEIGREFQCLSVDGGHFNWFIRRFKDRLISQSKKHARIRTNNEGKHILLQRDISHHPTISIYREILQMKVIRADKKKGDMCSVWLDILEDSDTVSDMSTIQMSDSDDSGDDVGSFSEESEDYDD